MIALESYIISSATPSRIEHRKEDNMEILNDKIALMFAQFYNINLYYNFFEADIILLNNAIQNLIDILKIAIKKYYTNGEYDNLCDLVNKLPNLTKLQNPIDMIDNSDNITKYTMSLMNITDIVYDKNLKKITYYIGGFTNSLSDSSLKILVTSNKIKIQDDNIRLISFSRYDARCKLKIMNQLYEHNYENPINNNITIKILKYKKERPTIFEDIKNEVIRNYNKRMRRKEVIKNNNKRMSGKEVIKNNNKRMMKKEVIRNNNKNIIIIPILICILLILVILIFIKHFSSITNKRDAIIKRDKFFYAHGYGFGNAHTMK